MSDGIIPSNEGRGYVLRRIIRRAIVQGNKISKEKIFLHKLVKGVIKKYSEFYFEIKKSQKFIEENLKNDLVKRQLNKTKLQNFIEMMSKVSAHNIQSNAISRFSKRTIEASNRTLNPSKRLKTMGTSTPKHMGPYRNNEIIPD